MGLEEAARSTKVVSGFGPTHSSWISCCTDGLGATHSIMGMGSISPSLKKELSLCNILLPNPQSYQ